MAVRLTCMCGRRRRLLSLLACWPEDRENGAASFTDTSALTYQCGSFFNQQEKRLSLSFNFDIRTERE